MTESAEPPHRQTVTAVSGFAYGVIGADIHVFGNGLPLYLLENWRAEPSASEDWLRELPSRMLNARRAVVPFTGRVAELADMRSWRDGDSRLAVRWLYGSGGQGKTRLAAQLAAESAAAGWKVIVAFHGPDADPAAPGSQDLSLTGASGLLVVIDYADRWLLRNLTWLLKNSLLHHDDVVTRVIMVGRTADNWPSIRGILDSYQAATSSWLLESLSSESGGRTDMHAAARDQFAGTTILAQLKFPVPDQTVRDHARCYPPGGHDPAAVLEPLYPDRLAEDFIALTLPGHNAGYPAQSWAPATLVTPGKKGRFPGLG